jgi:stress responsive alpha/beta barrel protein
MRNAHVWTLVGLLALAVIAGSLKAQQPGASKKPNVGKLRHVVLFKFKDDAPRAEVEKIEDAFRALPSKVPEVVDFEWGTNNSPEGLADGFTHCFFVTFNDEKGREVYLPHPAHKEFVALLKPQLDKVLVIDYVANE